MRFITTIVLLGLSIAAWAALTRQGKSIAPSGSDELVQFVAASIVRLDIEPDVHLEKRGEQWLLAGGWPARQAEVDRLVHVLASLDSRFTPIASDQASQFGLAENQRPLVVKVAELRDGGERVRQLRLGHSPRQTGRSFTDPTYARIDQGPWILRLAPGLVDQLGVQPDDLMRRQLFPDVVRVKFPAPPAATGTDAELPPPAEALAHIHELAVTGPEGTYTLARQPAPIAWLDHHTGGPVQVSADKVASVWQLAMPVTDRVDPEKLHAALTAVPELWVEQFVDETEPTKTGLDHPEWTLRVKSNTSNLTIQIGRVSRVREIPQPQPPALPGMPPPPPVPPVREEYRFAKLPDFPRVFEIRADRLHDLFLKPAELRDPRVARFQPGDVTHLDLALPERTLSFARQTDDTGRAAWRITAPVAGPAEGAKVSELVETLAGLQARNEDVIDSPDAKPYGLTAVDKTTTVTLQLKDVASELPQAARVRALIFRIGTHDLAKNKVFVQVKDSARINAVADDLLKLIERPALAYRNRRVLDVPLAQVAAIAVARANDPYTLAQAGGNWSLTVPTTTKADTGKAAAMFSELSRLDVGEFVNFAATPDEIKNYGLAEPSTQVKLTFTDASKAPETLLVGKPREGKPDVYAKLASMPEVFTLSQQLKETIEQPSLAYRPLQLWQAMGIQVSKISVERGQEQFVVQRDGPMWQINGPFSATAFLPAVQPLLEAASAPRAERFESHSDSELAQFGLQPPQAILRVTLDTGEKVLHLGGAADDQGNRHARLPDQPGVFVLPAAMVNAIDRTALDLLDRRMLNFDPRELIGLRRMMGNQELVLKKEARAWQIAKPAPATADVFVLMTLADKLGNLRAQRLAAFAATNLKPFGLDAPSATIELSFAGPDAHSHTFIFKLGAATQDGRFATLDDSRVYVIPEAIAAQMLGAPVQFRDRTVINAIDMDQVESVAVESGGTTLTFSKNETGWQVAGQPAPPAHVDAVNDLLAVISGLRVDHYVTEDKPDLKQFGLDVPQSTVTVRTRSSQAFTLHLGKVDDDSKRTFARTAERPDIVAVLAVADGAKLLKRVADLVAK